MTLEFQPVSEIGKLLLGSPFSGNVDDILAIDSKSTGDKSIVRIYVRHGANLVAFNVSTTSTSRSSSTNRNNPTGWTLLWNHQIFKDGQRTSYPLRAYPWLVTDTMLDDGSDGIVLRNEDGLGFYRFDPQDKNRTSTQSGPLQGLTSDTTFRDLYGWNNPDQSIILIGRFYRNTRLVGILSRQKKEQESETNVQFYAAAKDRLTSRKPQPLFPLQRSKISTDTFTRISGAIELYTADIKRSGQDSIILRTENQLEMYTFDENFALPQIAKVSLVDGPWTPGLKERFFFVDLTGQPYLDVVQFNRHGLFVYQRNNNTTSAAVIQDYNFVHYHAGFTDANGWIPEYDESIKLIDTNGDGRDDLLFTGPKGLTVFGFDPVALIWETLLDPMSQITIPHRFATVVGATRSVTNGLKKESILLTVDENKKLYMGKLLAKKIQPPPKKPSNKTNPVKKTPAVDKSKSQVKIPSQVKRTTPVSEKPLMRWTEQWAEPVSIPDVVDPVSGSVHFPLPVFEPSHSDPIPHRISLSYNSQQSSISNLVGLGWTVSFPENYITVDYRDSIFLEDAAFHLMMDGMSLQLKLVVPEGQQGSSEVKLFCEPFQPKWAIEFHQTEQRWTVGTEKETLIFGSTGKGAKEVVRWNLNWPLWRGPGKDVKSLKRVPVAWYLIKRQVKATGRSIIYHYDIDSEDYKNSNPVSSWTAAIRLKQISAESSTTVTFDYNLKGSKEYKLFDHPFDSRNNQSTSLIFPVSLRESHFLAGCDIETEDYKQRLEFKYQTDEKGKRLLTAIEQPIQAELRESIFQFSYHEEDPSVAGRLLREIQLPSGLKAHFQYDTAPEIEIPDPHSSVAHPVDERPAVDYSQDYAVMVFRQRQLPDKIQVKIMEADSLRTFAELSPIPAGTQAEGKVVSYVVRSFEDFCVVTLKYEKVKTQKSCLFHHSSEKGERKWYKDPTCYWFNSDAQIHFTEAGVAAINGKSTDVIQIFQLSPNRSKWTEHRLKLPSGREVIRFEMLGHLIVGYDDKSLFICHPDGSKRQWQMRVIEELPGLLSGGSAIVKKFQLPTDQEKILNDILKKDLLQFSSNAIAVSSLHLSSQQQLMLQIRLYLLDANYNVARRKEFNVKGQDILKIRSELDGGDGTKFTLGYYVTKSGFFRAKVVNVSGKLLADVRKASKSSPKMEDILKELNPRKDFQKIFDQSFLVDWSVHRTLLTQEGFHAGNGTFIRMTGDDWQLQETKKPETSKETNKIPHNLIPLGKSFVLEDLVTDDKEKESKTARNFTLYAQDPMKPNHKIGPLLHRLEISPQDRVVNRHPVYLAYGTRDNSTEVVLFSEGGLKFGKVQTFPNEELLSESSSYERMTTLAIKSNRDTSPEKMKFLARSLRSINPNMYKPVKRSAIKHVKLSNSDASLTRMTGYQWKNNAKGNVTVTIIPGNDQKLAGWIQQTWTNDGGPSGWNRTVIELFDADKNSVKNEKKSQNESEDQSKTSNSVLWDSKKERIVSNFTPFNLTDQMVSYFGFESYEVNSRWVYFEPNVVKRGFALTGANFLRLNDDQPLLEGTFHPTIQQSTYLASCWVRPSDGVAGSTEVDKITGHLKATISVKETHEEIVGLLGRIMRKVGDWSYIELLIDFDIVKRLFIDSIVDNSGQNTTTIPQLTITLKVDAKQDGRTSGLDVDHVRFTPMVHDFKATVYDSDNGRPISVIGSSGSISRTVCYRGREMAIVTDVTVSGQQQLEQVATSSNTGRLIPTPNGSIITGAKRSRTVFYPENGGLYEIFDVYAWRNRWNDSSNDSSAWTTAPARLWHNHQQSHQLVSVDPSTLFGAESSSAAIRCYYSLISPTAYMTWKMAGGQVRLARKSEKTSSTLTFQVQPDAPHTTVTDLPSSGEIVMMTEGGRFFIWIDSVLLLDRLVASLSAKNPWTFFAFEAQGNTFVEDCIFMGNPRTEMEYMNEWGEKMQTIQLESDRSVLVSQTLYDELGRSAITTKMTRITMDDRKPGSALLAYYSDFVSGPIDPANPLSVWQTHRLEGEVDRLNPFDGGVPYSRTEYEANPLNEKRVEGQPGLDFTVNGRYAKKFRTWNSSKDKIDVIDNHFPTSKGFRHKMEEMPNGTKRVAVFDSQDNRVALYIYVPGYNHLLSTYEYNSKNQLIKILPPIYHDRADTFLKSGPLWPMTNTEMSGQQLSPDEIYWQKTLGTYMTYDDAGRLLRKTTPDTGTFEYYYNRAGQIRLQVHFSSEESDEIDNVVFYEYDNGEKSVSRTGFLEQMPMSREQFKKSLAEGTLANVKDYQLIDRTEAEERHYDLSFSRGERNATFVTHNIDYNVMEEMRWDEQDRLLKSRRIVSDEQFDSEVHRTYYSHSNRLRTLQYPSVNGDNNPAIKLEHHYNKLGQLTGLSLDSQFGEIVRFSYHGSGQLASEYVLPESQHNFNRTFNYNSPGFLEQISDPFLTELVSYTDGGYGRGGSGDGYVTRTTFNATWSPNADWRWFQVSDNSKLLLNTSTSTGEVCLNALKRNGYVTKTGRPIKDYYYPIIDKQNKSWMPLICGGRTGQQLSKVLAQKRMPRIYGHRYSYGNHRELVKAKYFTEETEKVAVPFQPDTLAELTVLSKQQSRDIWKKLEEAGFIFTDQRKSDWSTAVANPGVTSLVKSQELNTRLVAANSTQNDVTPYRYLIEKMILNDIGQKRNEIQKLEDFEKIFIQWKGFDDGLITSGIDQIKQTADLIHRNVLGQVKDNSEWLDAKLMEIFRPVQYSKHLADFIRILSQHFTYGLGQHPFDVASFDIDANGNHHKFYTGFNRYEFFYGDDKANQIRSVKVEGPGQFDDKEAKKTMLHDTRGNVIQALHKGIDRIEYNSASMRTNAIYLKDGRAVRFAYDAHGERIQKRLMAKDGSLIQETRYVRDTEGKVLFDRRTTYSSTSSSLLPELKDAASVVVSTSYIYGPRGLLGFVRNGAFHSVWTDHIGSIRLVLRDGQVVAAYDYLPYGQLMRSHCSDPAAEIFYRYTGQEWDEETGLYNYHARLYDPDIGRFYQPDPREQYFSSYKYVGNSPVSLVDPDGEFGFLALASVALAVGGAYLGGAAANNRWNPRKWNWRSKKTWMGIAGGAIAGATLLASASTAVAAIGVSKTIAVVTLATYVSGASQNKSWNVAKWNWKDPSTYNALFTGAATGLGIVGSVAGAHQLANTFGSVGKKLILSSTYSLASYMAYNKGREANDGKWAPWKWDWKNPGTYNALMEGVDSGISWPTDLTDLGTGLYKMAKNTPRSLNAIVPMLDNLKLKNLKSTFASIYDGPIGQAASIGLTAFMIMNEVDYDYEPSGGSRSSFATYETFLNSLSFSKTGRNMMRASARQQPQPTYNYKFDAGNFENSNELKLTTEKMQIVIGQAFDIIRKDILKSSLPNLQRPADKKLLEIQKTHSLVLPKDKLGLQFSIKHQQSTKKPQELPKTPVASHRLVAMEDVKSRIRNRQNEVFTDREIGSSSCRSGLGNPRPKSETSIVTVCRIPVPDTGKLSQLKDDPVGLLKETAVGTFSIKGVVPKDGRTSFELIHADGPGYYLKVSKNPSAISGYWLVPEGGQNDGKIRINPVGETKHIFTSEMQGNSIYIKYDKTKSEMEVYHHNRKRPNAIYLNNNPKTTLKIKRTTDRGGDYVNESGQTIPELTGAKELFDAKGKVIDPKGGVIIPLENIYRKDAKGALQMVKGLKGKKMEDLIKENKAIKQKEDILAKEYDTVVTQKDYLGFPFIWPLLTANKQYPQISATLLLFRDDYFKWHVVSQKIQYPQTSANVSIESAKEQFKIPFQLQELMSLPFPIGPLMYTNALNISQASPAVEIKPSLHDRIKTTADIRDLDMGNATKGRSRRSTLIENSNTNYTYKCQLKNEDDSHDNNYSNQTDDILLSPINVASSATRPGSWIDLFSPLTGRQVLSSMASVVLLDSILEFMSLPDDRTESSHQQFDEVPIVELSSQLYSGRKNYRDAAMGNCYSFSSDTDCFDDTIVCYGHRGQTKVFSHSPSIDTCPPPLQQDQDTYRDCRPIEWHGQPSVTCRGDETTFIHTPYNTNSAAANFFRTVDSWLILAYVTPGIYRETVKFVRHVKNVWTNKGRITVPITDEDKQSWKQQLELLEKLLAEQQMRQPQQVTWALPLIEELRQQIGSLCKKDNAETMDDIRAVKTMTERLSALVEDVEEIAEEHITEEDDEEVFYDCMEEFPSADGPVFDKGRNHAEYLSTQLHHLVFLATEFVFYNGNKVSTYL
ncbi:hypothetical protein DAPPUDRAFT_300516 [Daphnia pulex]|uniref:Tox-SGS domain-containing protein n=1 Tax=Daphnia pulex TaxID=6669 RepID=E9HD60_DAPPU|nr:hypothetical protein DAPPUDRAFT_300516 [Daphnia pulex]|eukprot:EFX70311.1 hypothetical protein DAPPUDRAFT_300516 [Daphnia pulex]